MIKKVIFSGIFLCLLIAVPLALLGYDHVTVGPAFMGLMRACSRDLENFTIAIPDIPTIPKFESANDGGGVLEVLFTILNVLIYFVNAIIFVINIFVQLINVVIQLIQFIVVLIKNLIYFKDSVTASPLPVV